MTQQTVTLLSMLLPPIILISGLMLAVSRDTFISRRNRSTMLVICVLVFTLITQNGLECYQSIRPSTSLLRTVLTID